MEVFGVRSYCNFYLQYLSFLRFQLGSSKIEIPGRLGRFAGCFFVQRLKMPEDWFLLQYLFLIITIMFNRNIGKINPCFFFLFSGIFNPSPLLSRFFAYRDVFVFGIRFCRWIPNGFRLSFSGDLLSLLRMKQVLKQIFFLFLRAKSRL